MPGRFGPFDELIRTLDNLTTFGRQFEGMDLDTALKENARQKARGRIHTALIEIAGAAVASIEEFQYEPLKERFLENIRNPEHVYITHDLVVARVFSPKVGGTVQDLESGLYPSTAPHAQRLHVWQYGIYMPFHEGTDRSKQFEKLPEYDEVIEERLAAWGDKAPFWIFIESGNQSGNEAYPSFAGTGFIAQTLNRAEDILQIAIEEAREEFRSGIDEAVAQQLTSTVTVTRTEIQRIDVGQTSEGRLIQVATKESAEGVYYMLVIGGKFARKLGPSETPMSFTL